MLKEILYQKSHLILTVLVGIAIVLLVVYSINQQPQSREMTIGYPTDTVKAQVLSIVEQGSIQLGEVTQTYQLASIRILEGDSQGQEHIIDYGRRYILPHSYFLETGQTILVSVSQMPDGSTFVQFIDFIRSQSLLWLGFSFILVCILVSGWKGVRSLLGIALSVMVIIYYIIPSILAGNNPILVSLIGSVFFLTFTQYLVYGWTLKTNIALGAMFIAILLTGLIAVFFVNFTRLSGMGDENAMYLLQMQSGQLSTKNLLIGGIIVGALGILDDLVISQTSAVIEIYRANPEMTLYERYRRSMNIGRDHIAATVNTLVLAYLGASLSMFLIFSTSNMQIATLVNLNFLAEEIVRTLVGTIGLFTAVPITTFIACWVVDNNSRLERLVRFFGPLLNPSEIH